MPKLLTNVKESILAHARETMMTEGCDALSARVLARRCGIAVGTLYNYFGSKDAIVAAVVLEDWANTVSGIDEDILSCSELIDGMLLLFRAVSGFAQKFDSVWKRFGSAAGARDYIIKFHKPIRRQIAALIDKVIGKTGRPELLPLSDMLAESLLACVSNDDLGEDKLRLLICALDGERAVRG